MKVQKAWLPFRWLLAAVLAVGLAVHPVLPVKAANPSSGTLAPTMGAAVSWVGTAPGGAAPSNEASCTENVNCETFLLTLTGNPTDWVGKVVRVQLQWLSPSDDYDFYVHKGSLNGPIVARSTNGVTIGEADNIDPQTAGTGLFYVHVVYFAATVADQYQGSAVVAPPPGPLPPAPVAAGLPPRYQNHTPTDAQTAQGMGRNVQNEPSIGVNWNTGKVFYIALLKTLRVVFNDLLCPTTPDSLWEDKSFALTSAQSFDPILFTDSQTGRTFVSQNIVTFESLMAFTDTDGESWVPSQGAGIASGFDHQTVGGGPFHSPLTTGVGYQHAVYYCSQNVADANCALSLDGGLTFGPAVVIYGVQTCTGLHGHIKVGPDGTAYVPNRGCGGSLLNPANQAVVVSEDNGLTWNVRLVPGSTPGASDPSVAIDKAGRLYFGFADNDHAAGVAVSDDHGNTWQKLFNVATQVGVKSVAFPAMVAADKSRAAVAFYGSKFDGAFGGETDFLAFRGDWHLYVSHTYDGGQSWITVDATPNDPLQVGALRLGGGGAISRNLLDFFDAAVDAQGRVLIGYADGCRGACNQTIPTANGNSYTAYAVIARQSGGRRLIAQFDPQEPAVPGAPKLTVTRNGSVAKLTWSQSDNGGSPITNYNIFRSASGGSETRLATVGGTTTQYVDQSGDPRVTYAYRVLASNALGQACGNNTVGAPPVGSSCISPGITVVQDPAGDQVGAPTNAAFDIQAISIAEPFFTDGSKKLVFTMKVADLSSVPPNGRWRILWTFPNPPPPAANVDFEGRYYVGMNSDASSNVSFEFGTVFDNSPALVNSLTPEMIGAADPASKYTPDGTITMVLPTNQIGNPQAGDLIGGLSGRTFLPTADGTLRSEDAIDIASFAATYVLVGNAFCQNLPPTINCFEDDDSHIAYANGWHLVNDANASAGHFRLNTGRDLQNGMSFTFQVSQGATGALVYDYAKSPKGGAADVYIDGVFKTTLSFQGNLGSTRDPQFGFSARYEGLASGTHVFELRNLRGMAYVDQFCLENAFSSAQPTSGPGTTTSGTSALAIGQSLLQSVLVPSNALGFSVAAEADANVPYTLVVIDPTGKVLGTVNSSSNGIASVTLPVSTAGLYVIQLVNVGVGPVNIWTAATPQVTY